MAKKTYNIKASYTFEGVFKIKANTRKEAIEMVNKQCGLVIGRNIHTSLPDDDVDWDFNVHPSRTSAR